jgi:hypothetical protein
MNVIGLMLPVTIWGAVHFALQGRPVDTVVLAFVSVPLAVLDLWVGRRLLGNRPALVLGDGTLTDNASFFAVGRVGASMISNVRVTLQGVTIDFNTAQGRLGRRSTAIPSVLLGISSKSLAQDIERWLVEAHDRDGTRHAAASPGN